MYFVKTVSIDGDIDGFVLNSSGKKIKENKVPNVRSSIIGTALENILNKKVGEPNYIDDYKKIHVRVSLKSMDDKDEVIENLRTATTRTHDDLQVELNGSMISKEQFDFHQDRKNKERKNKYEKIKKDKKTKVNKLLVLNNLPITELISSQSEQFFAPISITLKKGEIKKFIKKSKNLIDGIDLEKTAIPFLDNAIAAVNIDDALRATGSTHNHRGRNFMIYQSELACPNPDDLDSDTYIQVNNNTGAFNRMHSRIVGTILARVSPDVDNYYCETGIDSRGRPTGVLPSILGGFPAVQNHSWGYFPGTEYTIEDKAFDSAGRGATIIMAAGNGQNNGVVASPAKGFNVVTVGAYNDSNNSIWSASSYKNPQTRNDKPEVSAPGVGITVRYNDGTTAVVGGTTSLSGTSLAAPLVAGMITDLISTYPYYGYSSARGKAAILASATDSIAGGYDRVGVGGVDFLSVDNSAADYYWRGYFDYFKVTGTNYIEAKKYFSSSVGKVKTAISWLVSADYAYAHRTSAFPLSQDYDLTVVDPNGNVIASSTSRYNGFEVVEFDPAVSGDYKMRITKYSSRGFMSDRRMSLAMTINY